MKPQFLELTHNHGLKVQRYFAENEGPGSNPLFRDLFHDHRGWFWIPSHLVDFDPTGPFRTKTEALRDAF
jgi:hypothetical protein